MTVRTSREYILNQDEVNHVRAEYLDKSKIETLHTAVMMMLAIECDIRADLWEYAYHEILSDGFRIILRQPKCLKIPI